MFWELLLLGRRVGLVLKIYLMMTAFDCIVILTRLVQYIGVLFANSFYDTVPKFHITSVFSPRVETSHGTVFEEGWLDILSTPWGSDLYHIPFLTLYLFEKVHYGDWRGEVIGHPCAMTLTGVEPMTFGFGIQCSANWAKESNKLIQDIQVINLTYKVLSLYVRAKVCKYVLLITSL